MPGLLLTTTGTPALVNEDQRQKLPSGSHINRRHARDTLTGSQTGSKTLSRASASSAEPGLCPLTTFDRYEMS
jgi:hypothetical protein